MINDVEAVLGFFFFAWWMLLNSDNSAPHPCDKAGWEENEGFGPIESCLLLDGSDYLQGFARAFINACQ